MSAGLSCLICDTLLQNWWLNLVELWLQVVVKIGKCSAMSVTKTPELIFAEVSLVDMLSSSVALCSIILVGQSMHGNTY